MLLQSLKLENFRQFRDSYIEFSDGTGNKNVTIIIGDNGTGKTTLAQAFFWCMYGETEFSDKVILNRIVANEMMPGQQSRVRVELKLRHGVVDYTLIREQEYRKDLYGRIKSDNTRFTIAKKDESGNTIYVKQTLCESEVKSILPNELSRYFFFDGERIEKMSKDITNGKKATDFAEAVKGILGLNAMYSAIGHFDPRYKVSVISSYDASYNANSDSKIQEYTRQIEECKEKIASYDKQLEEIDEEMISAQARKDEKIEEIKQYAEGEKLQNKKELYEQKKRDAESSKANVYKQLTKAFNGNLRTFISLSLIDRAMTFLNQKDFTGIDIPFMNDKTIKYLLKQKVCICGTQLNEGSMAYNKVQNLLGYLPPKSISNYVSDFKAEAKRRVLDDHNVLEIISDNMAVIGNQNDNIAEYEDEIAAIEKKLKDGDVRDKVKSINKEIVFCDEVIRNNKIKHDTVIAERAVCAKELERKDTERRTLSLQDDNNRKIELYKAYAVRIFEELKKQYDESEKKVRDSLQNTINDIFKQIYNGGLYLTIDEKYHITVYATDYGNEGGVETSTAQSIAVIFAFITGIIKMARDNRNSSEEDAQLLSSEPYPLVMDAPLSAFDKKRIKTVCESLPETAEQVVIFIKDTDGDLAERYMGNRIGKRYHFEKHNEFETELV